MSRSFVVAVGTLLVLSSISHAESSNRNEVRANLAKGGWSIVWGKNFTEGDWIEGSAAIGGSVASGNAGPFLAWFDQVLAENFSKIQRNMVGVARRDLERWIVESLQQKRVITYQGLEIQAGFATYNRSQRTVHHEPRPSWTWIHGPFGSKTKIPDGVKMHKVEHTIPLPNWHQFYVRYRFVGAGRTTVRRPNVGRRVDLVNPMHCAIVFSMDYGQGQQTFTLQPGESRWFENANGRFVVDFDASFAPGHQAKRYTLQPESRNTFSVSGNSIELYRR